MPGIETFKNYMYDAATLTRYIYATKDVYFYSIFPRTQRLWNKLPKDIIESNSLETFKTDISKYFIESFTYSDMSCLQTLTSHFF